jgi:putative transposase
MESIKPRRTNQVAPRKYPDELRERAIRMLIDAKKDAATRPGACGRIGGQLGINPGTLRGWVTQAEVDEGGRPGMTTTEAARVAELEREVNELRRANAILRSASAFPRGGARPPVTLIVDYIDQHKQEFGVEPICQALKDADLQIAPSTYYAAKKRCPSPRAVHDEQLKSQIARVHKDDYGVYGQRKFHAQLVREGTCGQAGRSAARCTTQRLMRMLGLRGVSGAKGPRTTVPGTGPDTRQDLVQRDVPAAAPNELWVADITYVKTHSGWVYAAFVLEVFSRLIVGWQLSTSLRTDLARDALNMGLYLRQRNGHDLTKLVHHSDRGVQGGLNRSSQHLMITEVCGGTTAAAGGSGPSAGDDVAGQAPLGLGVRTCRPLDGVLTSGRALRPGR